MSLPELEGFGVGRWSRVCGSVVPGQTNLRPLRFVTDWRKEGLPNPGNVPLFTCPWEAPSKTGERDLFLWTRPPPIFTRGVWRSSWGTGHDSGPGVVSAPSRRISTCGGVPLPVSSFPPSLFPSYLPLFSPSLSPFFLPSSPSFFLPLSFRPSLSFLGETLQALGCNVHPFDSCLSEGPYSRILSVGASCLDGRCLPV